MKIIKSKIQRFSRKGSTLALVLIAMILLMAIGTSLLSMGFNARLMAIRSCSDIKAKCAADAALDKALLSVNQLKSEGALDDYSLPVEEDIELENCDATFSYEVIKNNDGDYVIHATGYSGPVQKEVSVVLSEAGLGPFDYGLLVKGELLLKSGAVFDAYNLPPGEKAQFGTASNNVDEGYVDLMSGNVIDGDVVVGVGGDPATLVLNGGSTVTGDVYALEEEFTWPDVIVPSWLENLPSSGYLGNSATITESARYDSINLGHGDAIMIDGPVILYITGQLALSNSGEIQINPDNPDASLTVYLGNMLNCKTGGMINNLTGDPSRLKILGTPTCDLLSIFSEGVLYGQVYAPQAMMSLKSKLDIYGAVAVGAYLQMVSSDMHYDGSLRGVGVPELGNLGGGLAIKRWSE